MRSTVDVFKKSISSAASLIFVVGSLVVVGAIQVEAGELDRLMLYTSAETQKPSIYFSEPNRDTRKSQARPNRLLDTIGVSRFAPSPHYWKPTVNQSVGPTLSAHSEIACRKYLILPCLEQDNPHKK